MCLCVFMCVCVCVYVSSSRRQRLCPRVWCLWGKMPENFYPGPTWLWDSAAAYRPLTVRTHKAAHTLRISSEISSNKCNSQKVELFFCMVMGHFKEHDRCPFFLFRCEDSLNPLYLYLIYFM